LNTGYYDTVVHAENEVSCISPLLVTLLPCHYLPSFHSTTGLCLM
jgi:hypothetical protein